MSHGTLKLSRAQLAKFLPDQESIRRFEEMFDQIAGALQKADSSLTDIATRNHEDLQNIDAGTYLHLSAVQKIDLTDAGDSTLHYHAADRARTNHTGTQAHNTTLSGLQGGSADEYYHLTGAQHTDLTDGNASTAHYHSSDRARANHTGTQDVATITGLPTAAIPVQTNVTASRAMNTTYTAAADLMVTATVRCAITLAAGNAYVQGKSDGATPPVTIASGIVGIEAGLLGEDNSFQISFVVTSGQNYRLDSAATNGTVVLGAWFETVYGL